MKKIFKLLWRIVTFPFRALWWLVSSPFRLLRRFVFFINEIPEEHALPDVVVNTIQNPAIVIENINALRKHLLRIFIALVLCVLIMFAFTPDLIDILAQPIGGIEELTALDVTESVGVFMRVAFLGAVILASPYIVFELWLFVATGLKPREKKAGLIGIPLILVFFMGGIAFTYYLLLPTALPFLLTFMDIETIPRISTYTSFVTGLLFWMGVAFQFPLLIYVLTAMGLLQPKTLTRNWRIAVVIIAIAAAIITPTPDPVNMSIVMAPLLLLYLISIGLSHLASLGRRNNLTSV